MRTMTVREAGYLSTREEISLYPFDFGKQVQRFQRYIETSDWDTRLSSYAARFDKVFSAVVILLAVAFLASYIAH